MTPEQRNAYYIGDTPEGHAVLADVVRLLRDLRRKQEARERAQAAQEQAAELAALQVRLQAQVQACMAAEKHQEARIEQEA